MALHPVLLLASAQIQKHGDLSKVTSSVVLQLCKWYPTNREEVRCSRHLCARNVRALNTMWAQYERGRLCTRGRTRSPELVQTASGRGTNRTQPDHTLPVCCEHWSLLTSNFPFPRSRVHESTWGPSSLYFRSGRQITNRPRFVRVDVSRSLGHRSPGTCWTLTSNITDYLSCPLSVKGNPFRVLFSTFFGPLSSFLCNPTLTSICLTSCVTSRPSQR